MPMEDWVGREEERRDVVTAAPLAALSALLDRDDPPPRPGDAAPPLAHWLYFLPAYRQSAAGPDGHAARGEFLPPVPLPRRMWAGSRVRYLADVAIESQATRRSRILKVENKTGKRGALWFVTVGHETSVDGKLCISEEQDIVYREPPPPGAAAAPARHEAVAQWTRTVEPDTTLLFRYSALTFNGHRIHYDQAYATGEEGYPGLVVHGPLTATLLQQFALEHGGGRALSSFDFRGVSPLFAGRAFQLEGREADGSLALWARGPDGELAMSATAAFR